MLYLHGASGQPFAERTPTSLRLFVRGPDGLVAMRTVAAQAQPPEGGNGGSGGTQAIAYVTDVYHIASDHLGSTRVMVDEDGILQEAYSYGAWGEVAASVQLGGGVGYTFTGQEEDAESGLMNYRARLYDPALGRFLGVDMYKHSSTARPKPTGRICSSLAPIVSSRYSLRHQLFTAYPR